MSGRVNITVAVPRDLVAAVRASGVPPDNHSLLIEAGTAVIDAILAPPRPPRSENFSRFTRDHIPILPPAEIPPPSDDPDFDLKVCVVSAKGMRAINSTTRTTIGDLANELMRLFGEREGFVVLSCGHARIYDERWGDEHRSATQRTLHECGVTGNGIVHYEVSMRSN